MNASPSRLQRLVVGTRNAGKGRELAELLAPWGVEVLTLAQIGSDLEVVEDGATFADNARKKAREQALHTHEWVLADDSGLEVDALDGRPGVLSARYAGEKATDQDNNRRLLEELSGLPLDRRGARYYCHVAVADPTGAIRLESSGTCRGAIRTEPRGCNGFGYDPLFEVVEFHQTFGELGPAVKTALSHRARAMRAIVRLLAREAVVVGRTSASQTCHTSALTTPNVRVGYDGFFGNSRRFRRSQPEL